MSIAVSTRVAPDASGTMPRPHRTSGATTGMWSTALETDRKAATEHLWRCYHASRDPVARNRLVGDNLGLVRRAASEAFGPGTATIDLDDLVGAGTVGLIQAVEGFDPDRGCAFSTYAMPRIRGAIRDEIHAHDWAPRSVRVRRRDIARTEARLQQQLGTSPGPARIADAMGVDLATFWRWWTEARGRALVALEDAGHALVDGVADGGTGPDEAMARTQLLERMRQCLMSLPERDRLVLTLYYYEGLTLREIGSVLKVSESRICQIHGRALRALRGHIEP